MVSRLARLRSIAQIDRGASSLESSTYRSISSSSGQFTVNMPSPSSTSWERSAKLVKNTDTTNQYLEHIRASHDPSMHVKTIEDELRGTMGKALGKQGEKISRFMSNMAEERYEYDELVAEGAPLDKLRLSAARYNDCRAQALSARWELIVHRQAAGFLVDNHNTVQRLFPIDDKLEPKDCNEKNDDECAEPKQKFGTQLDWWQKVGRWR